MSLHEHMFARVLDMCFMFVCRNRSPLYSVTSRNVSSVSLISWVNLIVWWIWFIVDIYCSNSAVVPVHIMNISSVNLFHVWMWLLARLIRCSSSLSINRFAYAGAISVPMAVPCVCR